mmetsp:Transcript_62844/g.111034  ORF Transcript_62844/g.111034 Transcript_62844/m.111034 type:complete len:123 (+) Transcript_62844:2-370(+)
MITPDMLDAVWPLIVRAVAQGKLGRGAKAGPCDPEMLCCVYLQDFTNSADVLRVRDELASIFELALRGDVQLMLKPDAYSVCGIYRNNRWKVPPVLDRYVVRGASKAETARVCSQPEAGLRW